jgi:arabinose-5-phosphate isomerase
MELRFVKPPWFLELMFEDFVDALRIERDALSQFLDRSQEASFRGTVERAIRTLDSSLSKGGKIVVTGVGKSGKVASKIAATFSSTGSLAVYLHPTEGLHGDLGIVTEKDVVLALSYTGNTEELLRLMPSLKSRGVPIVAVVGNPRSQLAELATVTLDASVAKEACPINLAPTSSTTLALAIGDALAVSLMKSRGFDAKAFARNHPGGGLGKRLTLTVADVMHSGNAAGVLPPDASMDQVIELSTAKKLGGVLVTEGKKLLGLITDGDIRRALTHKERFFMLKAKDVMTSRPTTVTPELLASDALALMENRPSQISVLPVLDAQGAWLGLVRLHDLVKIL